MRTRTLGLCSTTRVGGWTIAGGEDDGDVYDLAIIGGGINGCGIARDAAGRGLKVLLAEKGDLASGTSSASTKLIHGGLRYLEHYEFRLVREALREREVLLAMAPHIIWPLRFVLPHHRKLRPRWMIRIGLFLYDHLGGRKVLPGSLVARPHPRCRGQAAEAGVHQRHSNIPIAGSMMRGWWCSMPSTRKSRGADIRVGVEVVAAERQGEAGSSSCSTTGPDGSPRSPRGRSSMPPARGSAMSSARASNRARSRRSGWSRAATSWCRRLFDHDRAYIFQNADKRIIFAIPYERDFTLIGTTDVDLPAVTGKPQISEAETAYLCSAASVYFRKPIVPADVVWSYAGVRPLYDEGGGSAQEATRDFVLQLEAERGEPALLNIFGGKITTYRKLAEAALDKLAGPLGGVKPAWTAGTTLPGGDLPIDGFDRLVDELTGLGAGTGPRDRRTARPQLRHGGEVDHRRRQRPAGSRRAFRRRPQRTRSPPPRRQ